VGCLSMAPVSHWGGMKEISKFHDFYGSNHFLSWNAMVGGGLQWDQNHKIADGIFSQRSVYNIVFHYDQNELKVLAVQPFPTNSPTPACKESS